MAPDDPDAMLRAAARARGFRVVKSRRRKRGGDRGKYGLTDAKGKELYGFGPDGLTASFEELEAHLRQGEASAWAESARTAKPIAPAPRTRRKPEAHPRPEPVSTRKVARPIAARVERPDTPLKIRRASKADARALAALLNPIYPDLGAPLLSKRLAARSGSALVAVKEEIIGIIAWGTITMLHRGDVARIALIWVDERHRRKGIGAALLKSAEERLTGCEAIETVSDIEIRNAQAFFRRLGYAKTSYRFIKDISS